MKLNQIILIISLQFFFSCSKDIISSNIEIEEGIFIPSLNVSGSLEELNIVTWNIEDFPKNNLTEEYVKNAIEALNVDIIALQEIRLLTNLNNIANALGNHWSAYRAPGSSNYGNLAYLINTNEVDVLNTPYTMPDGYIECPSYAYDLLNHECEDAAANSNYSISYDFAWRMPYILNFKYNDEVFSLINIHLKCCGGTGGSEEARRYAAAQNLSSYINNNLSSNNIIIVGDFNDDINDLVNFETETNIFHPFHNEYSNNYIFTDMNIANGSVNFWSYPNYPSHIDHIVINDNIFNNPNISHSTNTILIENLFEGGWGEYNNYISDHKPILINLNVAYP